ncbi:MAG: hypothetical protein GEU28_07665 [Dehalococcoidia bacterium]|nr:hypothetical protein [Dehalococcoidia bacterium]
MMVAIQRMTLDEFLQLPPREPALEFVDGEVVEKVAPDAHHGTLQMALGMQLLQSAAAAHFRVLTEVRFIFGDPPRAYLPDVAVVARDRLARDDSGRMARRQDIAPDVAIEVLSPNERAAHLLDKLSFYLAHGVKFALAIDDEKDQAVIYRPGVEAITVPSPETVDLSSVIPGLALDLKAVFDSLSD